MTTKTFHDRPLRTIAVLFLLQALPYSLPADTSLTIDASQIKAPVSPMLYGLMTEEINHSYDGGLYAELIQNRAFLDDGNKPVHWSLVQGDSTGSMALDPSQPLNDAIKMSLRLDASNASAGKRIGIANDGFWGIAVRPNTTYRASFYAKSDGSQTGPLTLSIENKDGTKTFASAQVSAVTSTWTQYTATLSTTADAPVSADNRFVISTETPGKIWFGLVSLFPPTFNNRPNGNRIDLMQSLVDLKPAFLRLPGGCYVEGFSVDDRYPWQKTLGDLATRPGHPGFWGYRSSDGMGLLEYMEWTEDMQSEPVLALFDGLTGPVKPGPDLEPFVNEALDEIEYVIGDPSTKWGAERVKDGHPAPFPLHWVEIGNEDFFDKTYSYDARFTQFFDAIRAKYPQLKIISTITPDQKGAVTSCVPDAVDHHDYSSAEEMEKKAPTFFDKMDRKGPKIFVGEWASFEEKAPWEKGEKDKPPIPTFKAALGDAAFMTAMERNSDLVLMQCYAPLFARIDPGGVAWRPDLIGFDALNVFGGPSYYAFKMFSLYHGDQIIAADLEGAPSGPIPALHFSVTRRESDGTIFIKAVNVSDQPQPVNLVFKNSGSPATSGKSYCIAAHDVNENNSITDRTHLAPVESSIDNVNTNFTYTFAPLSINVLEIPFTK